MPGTLTHQKFAKDIQKLEEQNTTSIICNKELYELACQGHDLGYFSKWYNLILRSKTHHFAIQYLQNCNFVDYVYSYIFYIKENNLTENIDVKNFLYGYISHHYLDVYLHPYIDYEAGVYDKKKKETHKYIGKHNMLETQIDKIILEKEYPGKGIHQCVNKHVKISKEIIKANEFAFDKVYHNAYFGKLFVEAMNDVYSFLKLFRNDRFGIEKRMYHLLDNVFFEKIGIETRISFLSFHFTNTLTDEDLKENKMWRDPVTGEESYLSFWEIYQNALEFCYNILKELEELITNKEKDAICCYEFLPNLSAIHGKKCNQDLKLQYYKK